MRAHASLAGVDFGDGYPVRIIGVINVSPESFYKGSITAMSDVGSVARRLAEEGADVIDVGAMSTAPYLQTYVRPEEEIARMEKAVKEIRAAVDVPISADTKRSSVAKAAAAAGAQIINDVSGLKSDPEMARYLGGVDLGVIICASGTAHGEGGPIHRVERMLRESLQIARASGIEEERMVVDPAIGFIRSEEMPWDEWDCAVVGDLARLKELGRPINVGVSRKSFIGKILGDRPPDDRLHGSLAASAVAVYNGADSIRTHDVRPTAEAVRIVEAIRQRRDIQNSY